MSVSKPLAYTAAVVLLATAGVGAALTRGVPRAPGGCPTARTYYVDAQRGDDANCGTTPATAWKTVARVNSFSFQSGDTVSFAGGEHVDWGYSQAQPADAYLAPRPGVAYGSYGVGQAIFDGRSYTDSRGTHYVSAIYLCGARDVTIANLDLEGGSDASNTAIGLQSSERSRCGPSTDVVISGDTIRNWFEGVQAGYADSNWTITDTTIEHTAGNGILFDRHDGTPNQGGDALSVLHSTIADTGEHPPSGGHVHGIYDNSANSRIVGNTITSFRTDGVSIRFHGAVVRNNHIADGQQGIGVYEYDSVGGTSDFTGNVIANTSAAAIFVCGTAQGCARSLDRLVIQGNRLGRQTGDQLDLQPTAGGYDVAGNGQAAIPRATQP